MRSAGCGVRDAECGMRDAARPDAERIEGFVAVRGDFQQYRYPVPNTRTLYGMPGARSTSKETLRVRAE